ncbi:MAG: hypothetical protein EP344_04555 [Bacteroidetes bacterium]|nr:MAG: hypothetical protein EP344_04555 [Bacteroidota bacterium]
MKGSVLFFAFVLALTLLASCRKEAGSDSIILVDTPPVVTALHFTVGSTTYQLTTIRNTDNEPDNCDVLVQNSNGIENDCSSWNQYYSTSHQFTLARQDDTDDPTVRLALIGTLDLDATGLPATAATAKLALSDLGRVIIPAGDDVELGTGPLLLQSADDSAVITVTNRKGNAVQGTFSGTVYATNGKAVEITDGTFIALLNWD